MLYLLPAQPVISYKHVLACQWDLAFLGRAPYKSEGLGIAADYRTARVNTAGS